MADATSGRFLKLITRYALSIAALGVAAGGTLLLLHYKLPPQLANYFFLAVIIGSAWLGGYGPGLLTTLITLLFGPYLTRPSYSLHNLNFWNFPEIMLIALLFSWMASARQTLRESNESLDERVRQRTTDLERANASLQERETLLIRQAEELSQSNADLEQFAYVASHDLQEPLRMIAIYAQLLEQQSGAILDGESTRFLQTVLEGVRRMERLVHDLLTYSRVIHADAGETAEIDSADALSAALMNLEPVIQASGAAIERGNLPPLRADRVQLTQVFQNLIGNAVKYRTGQPHIVVNAQERDGEWVFSVKDNGIGIHRDYHEMIFAPFKRLHGQNYPGSGVGLAICRRIVDRFGGRIWVESEPEQGSTFYFTIPAAEACKSLVSNVSAT